MILLPKLGCVIVIISVYAKHRGDICVSVALRVSFAS